MRAKLFFVIGAPKSGTTWLREILNAHPNIHCHSEGAFYYFRPELMRILKNYNLMLLQRKATHHQGMPQVSDGEALKLFRAFMMTRIMHSLPRDKELSWVGEKDPDHAVHARLTMQMFPDAAYIHLIRDGRDQCVSAWHHLVRAWPEQTEKNGHRDIARFVDDFAPTWSRIVRHAREARAATPDAKYVEIRYETLVESPMQAVRSVLSLFGDVDASDEVIDHCIDAGRFEKLSGGRKPGQEDPASFFRKGIVGDWRNYMDDRLAGRFSEATGGLLQELGYE